MTNITSKGIPIVKLEIGEIWIMPYQKWLHLRFRGVPTNGTRKRSFSTPFMSRDEIRKLIHSLEMALVDIEGVQDGH